MIENTNKLKFKKSHDRSAFHELLYLKHNLAKKSMLREKRIEKIKKTLEPK